VDKSKEIRCGNPAHRCWTVWRDGYYGRAPGRRQRYRCFDPSDPENSTHKFTPKVVRLESLEPHCLECESTLASGQGPNAARGYDFAAREIAAALVGLAKGNTYAEASLTARRTLFELAQHWPDAERPTGLRADLTGVGHAQPGQRGNESSAHGTLVATWVEAYTDIVLGPEVVEMPHVLLLDSTTFTRRFRSRKVPAFSVLCAYGYAEGSDKGRLLRMRAYRSNTELTWEDFLAGIPGMPAVVVTDGGPDVIAGGGARWPKEGVGNRPERVRCRWHLAKNLRAALVKDIKPHADKTGLTDAREHPLWQMAERAFDNVRAVDTYYDLTWRSVVTWTPDSLDLPASIRWMKANDDLIRSQLARRADPFPEHRRPGPETVGPLEAHVRWLRGRFAHRAQSLRNAPRTNQLLRLMVAGRNGQADERLWAERIRQHLVANGGQAPRQRQLVGAEASDRAPPRPLASL
jgi:hypothetical protein